MRITDEHDCAKTKLIETALSELYQTNENGNKEGKNPLSLDVKTLNDAGHKNIPLAKVIRKNCIDCCGFQLAEVRKCVKVDCVSWPYRMGVNPFTSAKRKDGAK